MMAIISSTYQERLVKIRLKYPKAYHIWTQEEDYCLTQYFEQGETVENLARRLQRQPSAIRSRLLKLGSAIDVAYETAGEANQISATPLSQPVYQVSYHGPAPHKQSVRVSFESEWHLVESAPGDPYRFPAAPTDYMLETYGIGCVYRWAIYQPNLREPFALYIGCARRLCPERLDGYLHPQDSPTNRRMHSQLTLLHNRGFIVSLEILQKGQIMLNDLPLDFLEFETQRDRLFIENLLLAYYRLQGCRLLNL